MDDQSTRQAELDALESLGRSGDSREVPKLIEALNESDALMRQVAATALGRIPSPYSVDPLIGRLADSDARVRQAAAWALGSIRDKRAIPALKALLNDPDGSVKRSTRWALTQMGEPVEEPGSKQKRKHRSRKGGFRWLIVPGVLLAILALGFWGWNLSLGPRLVGLEGAPADINLVPTKPAFPAAAPVCGGPQVLTVLIVGLDSGDVGFERGFADVIRVARIDFTAPSAVVLAVPRDLWVPIPGMAEHGVGEERVKTAYTYGEHYQVPGGGVSLLAQTLSLNFGLSFDRYIAADFAGFAKGIDALGGVQVTLDEPVGTKGTPDYFPAGLNLLDGERALVLARARPDNSSDLGRIERQTLILRAVRDKALSPQMADQVPALLDTLRQATRTDLSAAELTMMVCVARQLDDASTRTITLSGRTSLIVRDSYGFERLMPDDALIRSAVRAFQAGDITLLEQIVRNP